MIYTKKHLIYNSPPDVEIGLRKALKTLYFRFASTINEAG
jgi:hypothetical protein